MSKTPHAGIVAFMASRIQNSRNIILTGLMGTGKTTIGRLVAQELERKFIDTDQYIEAHFGKAAKILEKPNGDNKFRLTEELVAKDLATLSDHVISTGGRFMTNQKNIDVLQKNGDTICLVANLDEIVQRLLASSSDTYRPRFVNAPNKLDLMRSLQESSAPFFEQFEQIQTSNTTALEIARCIAARYQ